MRDYKLKVSKLPHRQDGAYKLKDTAPTLKREQELHLVALQQPNTWKSCCQSRKHAVSPCRQVRPHPEKIIYVYILA